MSKGGSAPESPDPEELAAAQAKYNRIDQFTPFGSLTYSGSPDDPDGSRAEMTLSPEMQRAFEQRSAYTNQVLGDALRRQSELTNANFDPTIPTVGGEAGGELGPMDQSTQTQQAVFQQAKSLLDPEFERREGELRQTLANQGLPTGGEAFNEEFGQFNQDVNRAYTDAAYRAVGAGNQRQNQLFSQGLSAMGAQQQARSQNLNEIQALLSGQQVQTPQMSQFYGPSQVDVMGAYGLSQQGDLAQYQASQRRAGQTNSALAGLGTAAIMAMCSRDYKTNKRPVENILPRIEALPVEAWEYKPEYGGGTHIGPYAEDFQRLFGVGDGKTINLIDGFGVCLLGIQELKRRCDWMEAQYG